MDIVVWLRSLGLGQYEAVFRENDIDETVLPSLTHENLKELGVASLGHRVKLLDAIAALRSDASGKTPSVDATASSAPSVPPEDRAAVLGGYVQYERLIGSQTQRVESKKPRGRTETLIGQQPDPRRSLNKAPAC